MPIGINMENVLQDWSKVWEKSLRMHTRNGSPRMICPSISEYGKPRLWSEFELHFLSHGLVPDEEARESGKHSCQSSANGTRGSSVKDRKEDRVQKHAISPDRTLDFKALEPLERSQFLPPRRKTIPMSHHQWVRCH